MKISENFTMENIVVGTDECKIETIVAMMMKSPTTTTLRQNWRGLAMGLDVWEASTKLNQDLATNVTDYNGVFSSLLIEWKSKKAEDATLVELIRVFSEECEWKDLADTVLQTFNTVRNKRRKTKLFARPPKVVEHFKGPENDRFILAINTAYADVVCKWICETVDHCQLVDRHGFVELCDQKANNPELSITPILPVIKHTTGEYKTLTLLSQQCRYKCIIVGTIPNDCTENKHRQKCDIYIQWDDLGLVTQQDIQDKILLELGLEIDESFEVLKTVDTSTIVALINGEIPEILKYSIPDPLPYYIPRRLIPRHHLKVEVLEEDDVFLVSGMSRPELLLVINSLSKAPTSLVNDDRFTIESSVGTTETSGAILANPITCCRFIVLEDLTHVRKLFKNDSLRRRPIHHLEWNGETFIWQETQGSIVKLQKYIMKEVSHVNESDLIQGQQSVVAKASRTVIISDTPGMGKTVLLANIARGLTDDRQRMRVVFIVISELVQLVKNDYNRKPDNTIDAFLDLVSAQQLARAYIEKNLENIKHVFMDAFDELTMEDNALGYECLKFLRKHLTKSTIWITTRPHLLILLERELGSLGYNIPPLDKHDQLNFLTRFWEMNETSFESEKAKIFGQDVLDKLNKNLNENEEHIAGIPLQCMLIGEIYKERALDFCLRGRTSYEVITISSLTDLFAEMINRKFEAYRLRYTLGSVTNKEQIDRTHAYFSFQLLFPAQTKNLKKPEFLNLISAEELFNVGILASASVFPMPKFIHRTFAEYFVAKFVSEGLSVREKKKIHAVFIGNVLALSRSTLTIKQYDFGPVKSFKYPVICYFINSLLMKLKDDCSYAAVVNTKYHHVKLNQKRLLEIAEACANERREFIYSKVFHSNVQTISLSQDILGRALCVATIRASGSHAKLLYDMAGSEILRTLKVKGKKERVPTSFTLLQVSFLCGNYTIVEILYKYNLLELQADSILKLLHRCIEDTLHLDDKSISDTLQIFDLVYHLLPPTEIYQARLPRTHPLDCCRVHPTVFLTVVEHYQLVSLERVGKHCVEKTLFYATLSLNADHYVNLMKLVETLSGNMCKSIINSIQNGISLLEQIVHKIELTEDLLELILRWEPVMPKCVISNTLLNTAIKSGKSKKSVVLLGKAFKYDSQQMRSTFKLLVERKQFDIVSEVVRDMDAEDSTLALRIILRKATTPELIPFCETLIANGADISRKTILCVKDPAYGAVLVNAGANVNECNGQNETPLHEAIKLQEPYDVIHSLISMGANVNNVDINKRTPLMNVGGLNGSILKLLVQSGANVHARDCKGWTTLHHAAYEYRLDFLDWKRKKETFEDLLLSGANRNAVDNDGNTPLHLACDVDIVTSLLHNGADPNAVNKDGNSPLHGAWCGPVVTALVDKGAVPNAVNNDGNAPLHLTEDSPVITTLVDTRADPNAVNKDGNTPLHLEMSDDGVIALLDKGANPHAVNNDGNTPLHCLTYINDDTFLLQKGADPNARNILGQTPLMFEKSVDSMLILLEKGADVNAVDKQGNTVFHHIVKNHDVCSNNFYETKKLEILLKSGINPTSNSNIFDTIFYAFGPGKPNYHYVWFLKALISADIDLSSQDTQGNTVFYCFEHMTTEEFSETQKIFNLVVELIENGYFEQLQKPNASGTSAWFHLKRLLNPFKQLNEKLVELEEHNEIQ